MMQNLLLIGGAIGLLVLGYILFIQSDDLALSPEASNPLSDQLLLKTQIFIERRAQLDTVAIDGQLFTDPRFTELRSYSKVLADQTIGKDSLFNVPSELVNTRATN